MRMKRILAFASAVVMAAAMAGCGNTASKQAAEDTKAKTESKAALTDLATAGKLVIGYTEFAPLNYIDADGNFTGYETEFSKAVCEKLGVKAEFQLIDWDSKELELKSKQIDCIWNGMTINDERKEAMSISIPYMENRQVLVVKADNVDKYKASLDGAKVVAEGGSAGEDLAKADAAFAKATYTTVQSQATALMEVKAGTADVAVIDYVMAGSSVGKGTSYEELAIIDNNYESEQYGVAFRKGSDITEAVNTAMAELKADGTLDQIADKYGLKDLIIVK